MSKVALLIVLALPLGACAHHQPKARCTGPLERINVSAPATTTAPSPHHQDAAHQQDAQHQGDTPNEEPKDEGSES